MTADTLTAGRLTVHSGKKIKTTVNRDVRTGKKIQKQPPKDMN